MGKSREIKGRIKAVKNIQRITRTMQMIATSKFSKAQQTATAGKPYAEGLLDLVAQLSGAAGGEIDHPLLQTPQGVENEITLVLTSDRGLCGPYNANVLRTGMKHIREHEAAKNGRIELVGKKGLAVLNFSGIEVAQHHQQFGDKPQFAEVDALADKYIEAFSNGEAAAVKVVYMKYFSAGRQAPEVLQLLPFAAPAPSGATEGAEESGGSQPFEFSPSPTELLGTLLPAAVKAMLFQAFNDAIVSEHVARMVAMKAATDNAGKMRKSLSRTYNRARQAQITTELTEIVSGAAALE